MPFSPFFIFHQCVCVQRLQSRRLGFCCAWTPSERVPERLQPLCERLEPTLAPTRTREQQVQLVHRLVLFRCTRTTHSACTAAADRRTLAVREGVAHGRWGRTHARRELAEAVQDAPLLRVRLGELRRERIEPPLELQTRARQHIEPRRHLPLHVPKQAPCIRLRSCCCWCSLTQRWCASRTALLARRTAQLVQPCRGRHCVCAPLACTPWRRLLWWFQCSACSFLFWRGCWCL